jgi:Peptidase family C54
MQEKSTTSTLSGCLASHTLVSCFINAILSVESACKLQKCSNLELSVSASAAELRSEEHARSVASILWFTYRSGFPRIVPYSLESDAGWGCMLRCAQMLMAAALQRHMLGADWVWPHAVTDR